MHFQNFSHLVTIHPTAVDSSFLKNSTQPFKNSQAIVHSLWLATPPPLMHCLLLVSRVNIHFGYIKCIVRHSHVATAVIENPDDLPALLFGIFKVSNLLCFFDLSQELI